MRPFLGMDPYLEYAALWPSVQTRLMVAVANQLKPLIRPRYVATIEERVFVEEPLQERIPDVWVQQVRNQGPAIAVAEPALTTPVIVEVQQVEVREHFVAILDRYRDLKVVTVVEVVSPSTKAAGPGRDTYLAKQRETLASGSHLVEIDLLRRGRNVASVKETHVQPYQPYDYLICVNRHPHRNRFELFPCRLRERLPRFGIPLAEPDPDVPLDLQAALDQVYDEGDYLLRVRYDDPCEPRLSAEDQQWASERWAAFRAAHPDLYPPPPQ